MSITNTDQSTDLTRGCWDPCLISGCNLRAFDAGFLGDLSPEDDFRLMVFIRRFEEALLRLFQEGHVNGTTHTCIGQEYVPVSLMPLLQTGDFIFSNHRGHGHYLARFLDPEGLMCEILGREGAVCQGVGGSQHIRRDRYFSTGVQGESVPVAVGAALGLKRSGAKHIALTFIGDGTWGEGSVYEALNMASLWSVPLVIVCENNGIAQTTPINVNMAGSIASRAAAFDVTFVRVEHQRITEIRSQLSEALEGVRQTGRPLVIEMMTQRLASHSKGDDTRDESEIIRMKSRDWFEQIDGITMERRAKIDHDVLHAIDSLVECVLAREASSWKGRS